MTMRKNPILDTDSYKASHFLQYPPGTRGISSYIEARPGGEYPKVLFFGLQVFLKDMLENPVRKEDILEAEELFRSHGLPFNKEGWEYIVDRYHGKLPLCFEAIPEGTLIDVGNMLVQVCNTDVRLFWLSSYIETALLRAIWYPTTVATNSFYVKKIIMKNLLRTSDDPENQINFKLHDFGARGVSSFESAGLGGMAHLVNFMGTDTVTGLMFARKYYHEKMAGFSIPAAEHSTITAWGGPDKEIDAFRNMLRFAKDGHKLIAVVSDSYDIDRAVSQLWSKELKQEVLDSGATIVVRPDSGKPVDVVMRVLKTLAASYGTTVNKKGYHVLHSSIRVIQGDGVTPTSIQEILNTMKEQKFSGDNIAFGMGGALLQSLNRDTLRFAMKASAINEGSWKGISKAPVSDPSKSSKKGILAVIRVNGMGNSGYITIDTSGTRLCPVSDLELVSRPVYADYHSNDDNNGIQVEDSFSTIRNRANEALMREIASEEINEDVYCTTNK